MIELLSVVLLLGSGITLGVFFAVAVSVAPALLAMAPSRYVEAHQLLGKGYHPTMPIITNTTTLAALVLAVLAGPLEAKLFFVVGAVLIIGVQAVSHLGNVPINRQIWGGPDGTLPADWSDPRPKWRAWHLLRTALAAVALLVNIVAVLLAT